MKLKVTEATNTVWLQETKQLSVELPDGRILGVREMQDDNGGETYFQIAELGEEITRRGNWQKIEDVDWKDDEERDIAELIGSNLFYGDYKEDELLDTEELELY